MGGSLAAPPHRPLKHHCTGHLEAMFFWFSPHQSALTLCCFVSGLSHAVDSRRIYSCRFLEVSLLSPRTFWRFACMLIAKTLPLGLSVIDFGTLGQSKGGRYFHLPGLKFTSWGEQILDCCMAKESSSNSMPDRLRRWMGFDRKWCLTGGRYRSVGNWSRSIAHEGKCRQDSLCSLPGHSRSIWRVPSIFRRNIIPYATLKGSY